jgi:chemotaxis protein methyltransferase CheR
MVGRSLTRRPGAEGWRLDADYPRLKGLIIARTGHFYYEDKDDLLWERVRKRFLATNSRNSAGYIQRLVDDIRGDEEWSRLESEITIGETFFFRYVEQFAALRRTILPGIIERNRESRRIRIWSAGCATGAEPYSLAILITELLGEEREQWRINIVGTDINESFLTKARQGKFGKWALRSMSEEDTRQYFTPADDGEWNLRPRFRSLVRFERHNLLTLLDGTSPLQFSEFDLILCRNVLIYFRHDVVHDLVAAFGGCLSASGWLLIGHAEPNPAFASLLRAISLPGTVAYRKPAEGETLDSAPVFDAEPVGDLRWAPVAPPDTRASSPVVPTATAPIPARMPAAPPPAPAAVGSGLLDKIRLAANSGAMAEARSLCAVARAADPLDPALHLYDGLLAQAADLHHEAEKSFRRALYLDKSFVMAHYHLGLLLNQQERAGPARRALAAAARLAAALPAEAELPEGDGLTVKRLLGLVRLHLDSVGGD